MLNNNMFVNKELFGQHFDINLREKRLKDFEQIYNVLKDHLVPEEKAIINKKLLKKYVDAYKDENKELIKKVIKNLKYITFDEFKYELLKQIDIFNETIGKEKYVLVIGIGTDLGGTLHDFRIDKSNFWAILLSYQYLHKPYDIIFNLNVATRLYYPSIKNFLIIDDAAYSGSQLIDNIIRPALPELLFYDKDTYINPNIQVQENYYKYVSKKICNIHLIVPYVSETVIDRVSRMNSITGFDIKRYFSYVFKPFGLILSQEECTNLNELYTKFINYQTFFNLIPIYFDYKIADDLSTIAIILIKGQVLDDPNKRIIFINACEYDPKDPYKYDLNPQQPNYLQKKVYCPTPPYLKFKDIIMKKIKK